MIADWKPDWHMIRVDLLTGETLMEIDAVSAYPESLTERDHMEIVKDSIPTQAEYNTMIEQFATSFYGVLNKAGFDKDTLTDLALSRKNDVPWDQVPTKVKLCIVRLSMAMIPKPEAPKKPEAPEVEAEILPPKKPVIESTDAGND